MLHQENQSKFTVKTDHLQWGHDGDTATSSVSDIDEEIICFEDTRRNNTNNHTCSQNLSSRNSGIGVCPSHLDTHGTPEVLTRCNQRKKLRNRTMNRNLIINDPNLIRYSNLLTNELSWYPRLNRNVQFLLRAMNIDIHLGRVLFASVSEPDFWNMLSIDPVELLKILVLKSGNDSSHAPMLPATYIIPIVFRMKLFRYHLIKYCQIETTTNGAFPANMSTLYLLPVFCRNVQQDFMIRLSSYESRFTALLPRLNQAFEQYIPDDAKYILQPHPACIKNKARKIKRKTKNIMRTNTKFRIQHPANLQHSISNTSGCKPRDTRRYVAEWSPLGSRF